MSNGGKQGCVGNKWGGPYVVWWKATMQMQLRRLASSSLAAAEILEDWVPLRCSAAGFGIGEEPQARCVQGRKTKRAKLSPVTDQNGGEGAQGDTRVQEAHTVRAGRLEQDAADAVCTATSARVCAMPLGTGPQRAGANSNKQAPLISAWSAIVHSDIDHGFHGFGGHVCSLPIALPSWTIPLRISGLSTAFIML